MNRKNRDNLKQKYNGPAPGGYETRSAKNRRKRRGIKEKVEVEKSPNNRFGDSTDASKIVWANTKR